MQFTIAGFNEIYKDKVKIIAGRGGMTRKIGSAGILDYEFLPKLKGKYKHSNFCEDQLVITTFLYAKENAFLITDAIKNLIAKGCSGLVIKNVFQLTIPDTTIKYANAKNFPIFISDSSNLVFEDFVYDVTTRVKMMENLEYIQREIDATIANETTEYEAYNHGLNLNPSFENQHMVFYALPDSDVSDDSHEEVFSNYRGSSIDKPEHLLTVYDGGYIFFYSWEHLPFLSKDEIVAELKSIIPKVKTIGISREYFYLGDIKASIMEALSAAKIGEYKLGGQKKKKEISVDYSELGSLKILLPYYKSHSMIQFAEEILTPIEDFDAETDSHLMETLEAYCENDYSFAKAAKALGQHENTVRYRMDKVLDVTGLSYKNPQEMQQLDLAYKIKLCNLIMQEGRID